MIDNFSGQHQIISCRNNPVKELVNNQSSQLVFSEERYRRLLESVTNYVYTVFVEDGMPQKTIHNQGCEAITGYSPEEFDLQPGLWQQMVHEDDRTTVMVMTDWILTEPTNMTVEYRIRRKNGAIRWVRNTLVPQFDQNMMLISYDGMITDITEAKEQENKLKNSREELCRKNKELNELLASLKAGKEELETAYDELKSTQGLLLQHEKMASIGQLAAGIVHEINNPVGYISSNLNTLRKYCERLLEFIKEQDQTIRSGNLDSKQIENINIRRKQLRIDNILNDLPQIIADCMDGTERVKVITVDLKSFSRVDDAKLKPADINQCIEAALHIVWNELKYKATINREYSDLPMTMCHPQQLNQVFMNLLVNAGHAIEQQGEITISTSVKDDFIYVAITDTGCGIPDHLVQKIFEPFFTTKEVGKGTGLGLSISYDIVRKHGGEIKVNSKEGEGTTFVVSIPLVAQEG